MGLLKKVAKVVGSAVLITTGTASAVMSFMVETAGKNRNNASMFSKLRDDSFDTVHRMWSTDANNLGKNNKSAIERNISTKLAAQNCCRIMMENAKKDMEKAKECGNEEKYNEYEKIYNESRTRFYQLGNEVKKLEEIRDKK